MMHFVRSSSCLTQRLWRRSLTWPYRYDRYIHSMVCVTAPEEKIAKHLAHEMLKQKLAACVNIVPKISSLYVWKGEICEDSEVLLLIKTRSCRVKDIVTFVRDNHPYEVSEVIAFSVNEGNAKYLEWIEDVVPPV